MKGSCFCGTVTYEVTPPLPLMQYCHCSRCQKITGSAHASNIYILPEQFKWLTGEDNITRHEHPEAKYFATSFCKTCGSNLPWKIKTGTHIVVPAGTLDDDPEIRPKQSIHWASHACWYVEPHELKKYDELPPKK